MRTNWKSTKLKIWIRSSTGKVSKLVGMCQINNNSTFHCTTVCMLNLTEFIIPNIELSNTDCVIYVVSKLQITTNYVISYRLESMAEQSTSHIMTPQFQREYVECIFDCFFKSSDGDSQYFQPVEYTAVTFFHETL